MFATGDRWYQIDSCPVDQRIVEVGFLAIDADDQPSLGRKIKARQNIDHATARGQLTPNHASRRVGNVAHQPTVQMHLNVHSSLTISPMASGGASASLEERSQAVVDGLETIDPQEVLYLPSSTLKLVLAHFLPGGPGQKEGRRVFPIPREEEGISILSGLALAGRRSVMIFQDNGVGNLLTALLTFPQPYHIPVFGIVTRRGGLGEYNSMIHTISERTEALLDAAGVRWFQLDARTPIGDWAATIQRAHAFACTTHRPVFVLVNLMGG